MEQTIEPSGTRPRSAPTPADVLEQMERVLASPTVSHRRRDLLRYLLEETLAGRADRLKGFTIALAVFGRDDSFDPSSDPVVRLEARRLRGDLDSYYVDAGSRDPVRITIPKGGYVPRFEWRGIEQAEHPAEPSAVPAEDIPAPVPKRQARRLGRRGWAALAVGIPPLAFAAWLGWERWHAAPDTRGASVIVLPFEALGENGEVRFLASGVTQELITDLRRFEGLRLFSVPASFRQDQHALPTSLGADLGVDYVVKGSVGEDTTIVRLAAQLYDARTGEVLWSETYDRAPSSGARLAVRAELAASVAAALGQRYGAVISDMTARLAGGEEPSLSSYACVLKAYAYRRTFRPELREPVLDCLGAAVERDPDYAEPWAMLGWLRLDAARYGIMPDAEVPRALDAAVELGRKAVALEPDSIVALQALSAIEYHRGNFDESERIQRRALALNPNDPDTLAQLSWRLSFRGRWEEGLAYNEKARARAISPPGWYCDPMTIYLYLQGRYQEMLPFAERSAAEDPQGLAFVAIAYAALGKEAAAREALARMAERDPAFARDPRVSWRRFLPLDTILDPLVEGLRKAGWTEPNTDPTL